MNNATIKTIAADLNLSVSTVSRALRDSYEISQETRKLVKEHAEKVNYRPNSIAVSLKENKSKSIGVVVPEVANNFFAQTINGIEDEAYRRGYHVVIFQSHESVEREKEILKHLYDRRVDGVLISLSGATQNVEHIKKYSQDAFEVVYFDRVPIEEEVNKVIVDNFEGAYKATEYMIKNGKRKIAHITSPPNVYITKERLAGYKQALADYNIPQNPDLIRFCDFDPESAYKTVEDLFKTQNPDAFFTSSDRLALNCYESFQKIVGDTKTDKLFFGFTNLNLAYLFNPPLHRVIQPAYQVGTIAAKILLDKLLSPALNTPSQTVTLKTEIKLGK